MKKLDAHLAKTLSTPQKNKINCLIHTKNINFLKKKLKFLGFAITGEFPFIGALAITTTHQNIKKLLCCTGVDYISSQAQVFAMMNVANKILGTKNLKSQFEGAIAYIDTGISPHLDFTLSGNRIIKFVDLINQKVFPYDDNGHGTFVAGVGSGSGIVSGKKYCGICPKSKIVSIKALDQSGEANATKILEAMQWIYDNHKKYSIKIVCMSFGSEPLGENDPIMQGAEKLWDSGIVVVSAAGNSGPEYQTIKSPGISPKIITVGGFDDNRINKSEFLPSLFEIAEFSSRGPALNNFKPDVVAPAVDIISCGTQSNYVSLSGTSVATPMIAGICALLSAKNPTFSPNQIKQELLKHTTHITFNPNQEGHGYVNFE